MQAGGQGRGQSWRNQLDSNRAGLELAKERAGAGGAV